MKIARMNYAIYSCEEWAIMQTLCDRLGVHYRTRRGYTIGYIEAIILCTDEVLKNMEDVVAKETVEWC